MRVMVYLPRLYNPNPLISGILHYIGFRVKKIDDGEGGSEWIKIKPIWWEKMSKSYDEQKALNIVKVSNHNMEEHQVGQTVQFNKYMDKKKDESLNTESEEK